MESRIFSRIPGLTGIASLLLLVPLSAAAQVEPPQFQLLTESGQQRYGRAVATDGNTLVVGASTGFEGLNLRFAGQVFYYERMFTETDSFFVKRGNLLSPNMMAFGQFGTAVAFDDDTIVVGAENEPFAYVFERRESGGYGLVAELPNPTEQTGTTRFGSAVAIDGDLIVIGGWGERSDTILGGAAYVFERKDGVWQQTDTLVPEQQRENSRFGSAVAVEGETIVVGDETWGPSDDQAPGAVFFFRRSAGTWVQSDQIVGTSSEANFFGGELDFDGETLVVSEVGGFTASDLDAGKAFVFDADGTLLVELTGTGPGDGFGSSVAVDGDTLLVGARRDGYVVGEPSPAGAVYEYQRNENGFWVFLDKVESLNPQDNGAFAGAVDVSGATAVIGASGEFPDGNVYAYARTPISNVDLAVDKTASGVFFPFGGPITYVITVSNEGLQPVMGATVEDVLPPELPDATWECAAPPEALCEPTTGTGNLLSMIDLPAGGSIAFSLTATTFPGFEGAIENVAIATPPDGIVDADPSNNTGTAVAYAGVVYADGFETP